MKGSDLILRGPHAAEIKELIQLSIATGMDEKSWVRKGILRLSISWNEFMYEKIRKACLSKYRQPLLQSSFPIPKNKLEIAAVNNEFKFAKIAYTDMDFGVSREHLNRHGLIIGDTGTGKTTVVKILTTQFITNGGIAVWVIDPKESGDFRFLAKRFKDVIILRPDVLRINPFSAVPNCPTDFLRESVSDVTSDVYGLYEASESIIVKNIQKILKESKEPTFYDFINALAQETAKGVGRRQGYLDSIGARIDKTYISLGNIINCKKDYLSKLYNSNVIFEVGMLSGFSQKIIINWLILSLVLYKICNPSNQLTNIVIFDESQAQIFTKQQNPGRTPTMAVIITQARSHGIGMIALAQNCRKLMDELISNSAFKLTYHLGSGEEIWAMSRHLGLNAQQVEEFHHLNKQEAICRLSFGYMDPVLLNINHFEDEYVSSDELDEIMQPKWAELLEGIEPAIAGTVSDNLTQPKLQNTKTTKPSDGLPMVSKSVQKESADKESINKESIKKEIINKELVAVKQNFVGKPAAVKTAAETGVSPDEEAYLRTVKSHPFHLVGEIHEMLISEKIMGTDRLSKNRCANARKKLIAKGLLESFPVLGIGVSGKPQCDIVVAGNIDKPRGGLLHSFWVIRLATYFKKQNGTVEIGSTSTGYEIDLRVITSDGKKIGVEIVVSGLVAENVKRYIQYFDRVLILAIDDKKRKETERLFGNDISMRIEFGLLKEYFVSLS